MRSILRTICFLLNRLSCLPKSFSKESSSEFLYPIILFKKSEVVLEQLPIVLWKTFSGSLLESYLSTVKTLNPLVINWFSKNYYHLFDISEEPNVFTFLINSGRTEILSQLITLLPTSLLTQKGVTSVLHLIVPSNSDAVKEVAVLQDTDLFFRNSVGKTAIDISNDLGLTELASFLISLTDNICCDNNGFDKNVSLTSSDQSNDSTRWHSEILQTQIDGNTLFSQKLTTLYSRIKNEIPNSYVLLDLLEISKKERKVFNCEDLESIKKTSNFAFAVKELEEFNQTAEKAKVAAWTRKAKLLQTVENALATISRMLEIRIFGSKASNIDNAQSDLDVVVVKQVGKPSEEVLELLACKLQKEGLSTNLILNTKVPVLKIEHLGVSLDVSLDSNTHMGSQQVSLVDRLCRKHVWLKETVKFFKYLTVLSGFNEPFKGGISSYGLVLMTDYFFDTFSIFNSLPKTEESLLLVLLFFSDYFGNVYNGEVINEATEFNNFSFNSPLRIADPMNPSNNVGSSSYKFPEFQLVMSYFHIALCDKLADFTPKDKILFKAIQKAVQLSKLFEK